MDSQQQPPRGRRRRIAALSGVAAMVMLGGLSLAQPAAAVGPYATSTASPPSSTAPPMPDYQSPSYYTYDGSSTYQPRGYSYTY